MADVNSSTGDIITGTTDYDQYDATAGWMGNISQGTGFFINQTYKVKSQNSDTLLQIGTRIRPDSSLATINVSPGWNWIGFVANKNVLVNSALGNYNAVTGDLIKSQYEFAYFNNSTGWIGSLTHMKPTMGYMLLSSATSTFSYPLSSFMSREVSEVPRLPRTSFLFIPKCMQIPCLQSIQAIFVQMRSIRVTSSSGHSMLPIH